MLFAGLKNKPIRFAEIGVAMGCSAAMWSRYFTHAEARIIEFDRDTGLLEHAKERVIDGRLGIGLMDVEVDGSVAKGLGDEQYDVILDDSSHNVEHQIRIIREAFPRVKPGGMLIIEDVFRAQDEEEYIKNIQPELAGCSAAYFVICEHQLRWSPGWDNDKLFVLVKA
jgi:predicted O-methyltransferase YrrM